jgi:tRNA threonylcarbamoyladenosine biosynthesis protein TsaB
MTILALDTCTEMCSVAVLTNATLYEHAQLTQRGHSDLVLGMLEDVLAEANTELSAVDYLAFGRGPGSFTGVRVGVGVAQGIAFARQLPVIPISTLAAVAQRAIDEHGAKQVAVALDARMGEVYSAHYREEHGLAVLCDSEQVCAPESFKPLDNSAWFAAGTGWREYQTVLEANFDEQLSGLDTSLLPTAAAMAKLAKFEQEQGRSIPAEQAVPVYLRDNVAKKKGEQ